MPRWAKRPICATSWECSAAAARPPLRRVTSFPRLEPEQILLDEWQARAERGLEGVDDEGAAAPPSTDTPGGDAGDDDAPRTPTGRAPRDDDESGVQESDEDYDDEDSDGEGTQGPPKGDDTSAVADFCTACHTFYNDYKELAGPASQPDGHGTGEYTVNIKPADAADKRTVFAGTIQGVSRRQKIPMAGKRLTFLSDVFFPERHAKTGEWLISRHVTFDEGHVLRDYGSQQHVAATLVPKQTITLLTGTPLYNHIGDFRSYMFLIAVQSKIDHYLFLMTTDIHSLDREFQPSEDLIRLHQRTRASQPCPDPTTKLIACRIFAGSLMSRRALSIPLVDHKGRTVYPTSGLLPCHVHTTYYIQHNRVRSERLVFITDLMNAEVRRANMERASGGKTPTIARPAFATDWLLFRLYLDPEVNNRHTLQRLTLQEIAAVRGVLKNAKTGTGLPDNLAKDSAIHARLA
ncbi:hypothetical protein KVR01_007530 [Diaporthe batatas]|uniref:uncharacterized protein n=1 Tax=Diaporthe batatas TaxID=748121 RepID=UPI001D050336|nr:uncharacterized protein KVR01_007530 [Diaporthe batatas]KAG8163052.1 hypothetical protein KVR01_007530 [Diaporthe batatas]